MVPQFMGDEVQGATTPLTVADRGHVGPALYASAIGWLATVAAFFPGVMSPDSLDQLRQAEKWSFSTPAPPIMSVIWGLANLLVRGPALMLLLQATGWWLGWYLIVRQLFPRHRWLQAALIFVIGFWPPLFAMIGTIWRDVHFTLALCLAISLLLRDEVQYRRSNAIVAALLLAYGSEVRVNAVFSVVPLALWAMYRIFVVPTDRLRATRTRALAIVCLLGIIFGGRLANRLIASRLENQLQVIEVFDLAGISARTGQDLMPPGIRKGFDRPDQIASAYTAFSMVPLYLGTTRGRMLSTDDRRVLAGIRDDWWMAVKRNPRAYLAHRTAAFTALMGWNDLPVWYPFERGILPNEFGLRSDPSRFSDAVYGWFNSSLQRASFLWRPWIYLWLTSILALLCVAEWVLHRHLLVRTLLVLSSSILYTLPYFIVVPTADLRFEHWPIAAFPLSLMLFIRERSAFRHVVSRTVVLAGASMVIAVTALLAWGAHRAPIDYGEAAPVRESAAKENVDGLEHMARGDFPAAIALFEQSAADDPHWYVPHINLGIAHKSIGEPALAIESYGRAVDLDRSSLEARTYRGEYLLTVHRYGGALKDFELSIDAGNRSYENFEGAATAAAGLGLADLALSSSEQCIALDQRRFESDIVAVSTPFFETAAGAKAGLGYFLGLKRRLPQTWWVDYNIGTLAARTGDEKLAKASYVEAERLKATK